jgi:transposase
MKKVVARRLRPGESQTLHPMKRQWSNAVNRLHARIVLLSVGQVGNAQIAERCGCTATWVRTILHRFNEGGLQAICYCPDQRAKPPPRKFLAYTRHEIGEVALAPPVALIGLSVWSLPKLRDYLIDQRIVPSISIEWLRQILRADRIRWRHTKTWKESTDPLFARKRRRIRRLKHQRPPGGVRLSIDEFGPLNLLPRHGMHYARIGHVDRHRATYSRHGGVQYFFGCLDIESHKLFGQFHTQKNHLTFLSFLKGLRRRYRHGQVLHIVLDNASYHLTDDVLAWAAAHKIRFYWTPTNASWLNWIECHFTAMKKFCLDNTDHRTHQEVREAIRRYLDGYNGDRTISWQDWRIHRNDYLPVAPAAG